MATSGTDVDGRRQRRMQNREAVLDALAELFGDGNLQPSTAEIAERAGLSPRSLFRYFDDVDDLNRAVIERQLARARPLLAIDVAPDAPTAEKIATAVKARMRLFETIGPTARAARICAPRHAVIADRVAQGRDFYRSQVRRLFAPELADRPDLLPAVDVLLSFETHELLRGDHGLNRAKATRSLTAALSALLVR
jgi:AcrR family transcriptional regulator